MKKVKEYIVKYFNSWVDNGGDYSHYILNKKEMDTALEIAYLEGQLKYTIWADYIPNGNEECDRLKQRLKELTDGK